MAAVAFTHRLILRNAAQVVCICKDRQLFLRGPDQNQIYIIENGSVVVNNEGNIEAVGPADEVANKYQQSSFQTDIDASGMCVLPGLVDGHTHPVWAGSRVNEFGMKLQGATYMEIHAKGKN